MSAAGDPIDPYHKWLGIPKSQQPATHYRMLGIELFEHNPDVIDAAASRQVAYLHQLTSGPHRRQIQKLMNEIAKARRTLSDVQMRERYDEQLRQKMASETTPVPTGVDKSSSGMMPPAIDVGKAKSNKGDSPVVIVTDDRPKSSSGKTHSKKKSASSPVVKSASDKAAANKASETADVQPRSEPEPSPADGPIRVPKTDPAKPKRAPASSGTFDFSQFSSDKPKAKEKPARPPDSNSQQESRGNNKPKVAAKATKRDKSKETVVQRDGKPRVKAAAEPIAATAKKQSGKPPKPQASETEADRNEEHTGDAPKRRGRQKSFWQSNDWRIHVGISVVTIVILVIILVRRGGSGDGEGGGADPKDYQAPKMQSFDEKFK